METVWYSCPNPHYFRDALHFAEWLMLHTVPFSVEYDRYEIGFSGIAMEKKQMEYWQSR